MRFSMRMTGFGALALMVLPAAALADAAKPPSVSVVAALKGLSPTAHLPATAQGRAALAANEQVTNDIQTGAAKQPLLLSFSLQQGQALRDAFITFANGTELADGLGPKLGNAYQSLATYKQTGKKAEAYGSVSPNVDLLFAVTAGLTAGDATAGKYFFANGTLDGKTKAPADLAVLLAGGTTGVFNNPGNKLGEALPAPCGTDGDKFGDSRPFQTEKTLTLYKDPDYFGAPSGNLDYLCGPAQDLQASPSFPSGHTTYGYTESLLFALMVPERYSQMIVRGAEYGNDRIIVGAHYAMDVIGGRTLAEYDVAHLLANAPGYVDAAHPIGPKGAASVTVKDYPALLAAAAKDLRAALEAGCGGKTEACAAGDDSRFGDAAKNEAFYESTQTYGLPVVFAQTAGKVEDVAKLAPEAGYLLTAAFPKLTLQQADAILTQTEGPGGGFLDNGSGFGVYSRLDLYKASLAAEQAAQ